MAGRRSGGVPEEAPLDFAGGPVFRSVVSHVEQLRSVVSHVEHLVSPAARQAQRISSPSARSAALEAAVAVAKSKVDGLALHNAAAIGAMQDEKRRMQELKDTQEQLAAREADLVAVKNELGPLPVCCKTNSHIAAAEEAAQAQLPVHLGKAAIDTLQDSTPQDRSAEDEKEPDSGSRATADWVSAMHAADAFDIPPRRIGSRSAPETVVDSEEEPEPVATAPPRARTNCTVVNEGTSAGPL
jgi:hypothetical protein